MGMRANNIGGIAVLVAAAVASAAVYGSISFWSRTEATHRFMLVADSPLPDRNGMFWNLGRETGRARHDEIRSAIRGRLLNAYRTLGYAKSGKWSLATWAQLQWVRDTLDGHGLENIQVNQETDSRLRDFSFVRLMNELVETALADQRPTAEDARRAAVGVIEALASTTPNTRDPQKRLEHIISQIKTDPRLQTFVSDFPRLSDPPPPQDDY